MYVDLTSEQKVLRAELRSYFGELVTDELRDELRGSEGGGPEYTRILRQLGRDGWLGIGWPKEYGGQDRSPPDRSRRRQGS
jgi:alkylation response protein AidB-like acyl-CoA dehydrogenase